MSARRRVWKAWAVKRAPYGPILTDGGGVWVLTNEREAKSEAVWHSEPGRKYVAICVEIRELRPAPKRAGRKAKRNNVRRSSHGT